MTRLHRRALKCLAVVAAASVLSACGGGSAPAGDDVENVFVVTLESDPPHFNMGVTTDGSAQYSSRSMFEPLVNLTEQFEIAPGLATEWSSNDDSTEFTFTLQEGVTWHDGEPFTSADVAFYFDEVIQVHPLAADIAAVYDETETPDEHTAVVKLSAPYGPFFASMTPHYMIPAHLYSGTDIATNPANLEPVGTGPFVFDSFTSGDSVIVTKNDEYWGEQGDVDKIVYKIMPDANSRAVAFQSGEVDLALKLPIIQMTEMEGDDRFKFENAVMAEHLFMFFNTSNANLQNPEVRKALFHAVNRSEIADKVYHGTAEPSRSLMPNQVEWAIAPSVDFSKTFEFDTDLANKMLDKAGATKQADGTRFTVRINFRNSNPTWAGAAELIKASFEEIGVKVDLISQETSVYGETVFGAQDFDITLLQLGAFADPTLGTARAYVCNAENVAYRNPTGICDAEIDAAFTGAASTADQEKRVEFFTQAAEREAEVMGTAPLLSIKSMESFRNDKWSGIEGFTSLEKWDWSALVAK